MIAIVGVEVLCHQKTYGIDLGIYLVGDDSIGPTRYYAPQYECPPESDHSQDLCENESTYLRYRS